MLLDAPDAPDGVGLEQMRHCIQRLVELLPLRLVGTQRDGPVGRVLEPLTNPRVAFEADPMRVIRAEREPAREPPVHVELQRVIRVPEPRLVLVDSAETLEGTEQIRRVGRCPGSRVGAERQVLVLRQISRADVHRVQVLKRSVLGRPQAVDAVVAHIRHVSDHAQRQRLLDADLPLQRGRDLRIILERIQRRHRLRA